jgi:hypothetical protein
VIGKDPNKIIELSLLQSVYRNLETRKQQLILISTFHSHVFTPLREFQSQKGGHDAQKEKHE